jgi:hypothetical protein
LAKFLASYENLNISPFIRPQVAIRKTHTANNAKSLLEVAKVAFSFSL